MAASYALALDPEDLAGMFGSDDAYLAVSVRTDGAEDLGEFNVDKTFIQGVLADKGVVPVRAAPLQEPRVLFTEDELSLLCDDLAQHLAPVFGANLSRQLTAADWERASAHLPQGTTRSLVAPIVSAAVFAALDRKGAGVVSWQDYVQVLALMARGSTDDKLRLAFRMYGGSICLDSGIFRQRGEAFVERSLVLSHNSLDRRQMAQTLQDFANSLFASAALVGFDAFCQLAVVVPQVVSCFGLFDFVSFEVDSILSQRKAAQQREQLEQSESRLVLDLIQYGAAGAAVAGGLAAAADDDDDADGSLDSTDSPAPDQSDAAGKKRKRTGRDAGPPVVGKPHPERPDCSCKSCNRIRRNRESARAHQQRKNAKIVELESTNKSLQEQVTQLKALVSALQQQNVHLQNKCGTMDRQISALEAQLAATPAAAGAAPAASPSFGFHTPGLAMHGMMGTLAMASDGCN